MGDHGDEFGYPGEREILERALRTATTQVLRLAPEPGPAGRPLLERGADAVRGFDLLPAVPQPATGDPEIVAAASKDGIPPDIAEAYIRAKTEVKAILAEHLGEVVRES